MPSLRLGPVFFSECVTAARRWQTYAGRVAFLAVLQVSLGFVWAAKVAPDPYPVTISKLARVGESFFYAIAGTQLTLVLLAAPAYTAGAVCLDKARGTLAHMLVTDLSAAEIVLGKLGARLLPVLGLLLAGLPILALAVLLGGIDPLALFGGFLVTLGVGVAGCALALTLSAWGNKPHEVLLGTYAVWAVLLMVVPGWYLLQAVTSLGPPPTWLENANPYWLAFAPYLRPQGVTFDDYLLFLGGCLGLAAVLVLFATLTLRRAAQWSAGRARRRRRHRLLRLRWLRLPRFGLSLDFNPVLWYEWHRRRPSRWVRVVWIVYALLSAAASVLALISMAGGGPRGEMAAFVNAFTFAIGLLLVSVTAVTSLFEERVRGSLDVLLTTPLPTSSIVWGKWLGTYRTAVAVGVLPALLAAAVATAHGPFAPWPLVGLMIVMMLAYGALVTSLGLALATWVRRFGLAVALSVVTYVLVTGGSVMVLLALGPVGSGDAVRGLASISPWYGVGETTAEIDERIRWWDTVGWKVGWIVIYTLAAAALAVATWMTFDRCLGRVEGSISPGGPPRRRRRVSRAV